MTGPALPPAAPGGAPSPVAQAAPAPSADGFEQRLRRLGVAVQSPILVRELRTLLRGRKFFASHMLLLTVLAGVLLVASTAAAAGQQSDPASVGQLLFYSFAAGLSVVVIFLVPAFSCTAITTERESKTLDLLLTTTIRPWEIVWGKLLGALTVILLYMASALPLVTICFLFGGISPWDLAALYTAVVFGTLVVSSVSLSVSAHCRESKAAVVIAYVLTLVIAVGLAAGLWTGWRAVAGRSGGGYFAAVLAGFSGAEQLLIFAVPSFLGLSIFAVNFAAAANLLKPATANRSTNLRVTWFVFLTLALALYAVSVLVETDAGNLGPADAWSTAPGAALAVAGPLLWLGALYFASEETILPPRVVEDGRKLRGPLLPLRLFMPGPLTGMLYSLLSCAAVLGGLCFFSVQGASGSAGAATGLEVTAGALPVALFVLACAGIAAIFSSMGFTHRGAGLAAFGVGVLLGLGPVIVWLCHQAITRSDEGVAYALCCLSPLTAAASAWEARPAPAAAGAEIPVWLVSSALYACLAGLLWLLAVTRVWSRRRAWQRELELAAAARGGEAPAPAPPGADRGAPA